jgi:hypothetical protein
MPQKLQCNTHQRSPVISWVQVNVASIEISNHVIGVICIYWPNESMDCNDIGIWVPNVNGNHFTFALGNKTSAWDNHMPRIEQR